MRLRKILFVIVVFVGICWIGIFLFIQYKTDVFIRKFAPSEVQISYEHLYIFPVIKHPLTIIIKNIKAGASGVVFRTDIDLYPSFSSAVMKMYVSVDHGDDKFSMPMIVTTKRSENKNFYLATSTIDHALASINGAKIEVNGGIEFFQDKMPLGGYDISISDTQKLLESDLLSKYPKILYKLQKILGIMNMSPKFRLDYTDTGMKLDGVSVENL